MYGLFDNLRMILLALATGVVALVAVLAVVTVVGIRAIERAYPPMGRFVDVDGGRLHILELGRADAPVVVLLHGASGNLGDMRLALGDLLAERYRVIMVDRPGHGWSDRPGGSADASPARQAAFIHQGLASIGVERAIIVGHSWSGAAATAYTLAFPEAVSGLVLLAPATHPWPGGVAWINRAVAAPVIGPLLAHTLVLPLGSLLLPSGVESVFAPQTPPPDYVVRTGTSMVLRPSEFMANAQDIVGLKNFLAVQAPRYGEIRVPVTIIAGDDTDKTVSTEIHARAIARQLPRATLAVLPGVGHMVQYAARDRIVEAINAMAAGEK